MVFVGEHPPFNYYGFESDDQSFGGGGSRDSLEVVAVELVMSGRLRT